MKEGDYFCLNYRKWYSQTSNQNQKKKYNLEYTEILVEGFASYMPFAKVGLGPY